MTMPVVFFGSSSESLPLLDELQSGLAEVANLNRWNTSFVPGSQTLDELRRAADESDFAVFVFGPDDWTESRNVTQQAPRDNVVFEAGLFGGVLGFDRVYIVHEEKVKLPSDLEGFTCLKYKREEKPKYQVQHANTKIRKVIRDKGPREGRLSGIWWQYHLTGADGVEKSSLAIMKIDADRAGNLQLKGRAWTEEGELIARFRSRATSIIRTDPAELFYFWVGDWPEEEDQPDYHGRGEITLTGNDSATGWYTTESDDEGFNTERHKVEYVRGTKDEIDTVKGKDREMQLALIKEKLENRPIASF